MVAHAPLHSMLLASSIALAVVLVAAFAEWVHARRIARVRHLAFGRAGRPPAWARIAPPLRIAGAGAAAWGFVVLAQFDPVEVDADPAGDASRHLLICLDVSPSMQVKDAGPEIEKLSRAAWAGRIVQGVLDRMDMTETRISVVGFYTDALPLVTETTDKEVIRNALDGLPMYVAFEPGPTDIAKGLMKTFEIAKPWARDSTMLLIVSDGDASATVPPPVPSSIADVIVIGVGDPVKSTVVGGHSSRQDSASLKQIAVRLGGFYHQGNTRHLPSAVLDGLTMIAPRGRGALSVRDLALLAVAFGCSSLAFTGPLLMLFGTPRASAWRLRRPEPC